MSDFTPQGDINLRDTYELEGATKVTATEFYGDGSNLTGVSGNVSTSGTPIANDFARFSAGAVIAGLSYTETRSALNIEDGADVTDSTNVASAGAAMAGGAFHDGFSDFVANEHLDWTADQGAINIHSGNYTDTNTQLSDGDIGAFGYTKDVEVDWTVDQNPAVINAANYTDTNTTYTAGDFAHDSLASIPVNDHLDWTADQGAKNIHSGNYTDTTYAANQVLDWTADQGATNINAGNYTNTGDTTAHASFSQLDYASAGHTGFAPALTGDQNYVTDDDITLLGNTSGTNSGDQDISGIGTNTTAIDFNTTHRGLTNNPHSVDKTDVSLGNVPNVDCTNASNISSGTISSAVLPPVALTSVQTAVSEVAMLALTTEEGDVVIRTDENKSYMHNGGSAGTMADFTELQTPTDSVLSVNGETGTVVLTTGDIGVDADSNYVTDAQVTVIGNTTNTNSGDQTSIVGITGTKSQFNTAVTDGDIAYSGGAFHDGFSDFVVNEHLDWTTDRGATNIHSGNYTNTTYTSSDFTHDSLTGVTANEHLDWTTDLGATNINAANYTDTGDTTDHTALSNIGTQTHAQLETAIGLNTAKETDVDHNVTTNITVVEAPTNVDIQSSDGTNDTIAAANATNAGVMTTTMYDEHVVNNAKDTDVNHNVSTNLSVGTKTATTMDVNSSDGTNATLVEADTTNAGLLGADKWDEIVANTNKISYNSTASTKLGTIEESADVTDATNVVSALSAATLTGALTAADHGTAATDQVVNVCYGTGSPPTANTTTIGSLFVKYTA